MLPATACVGPWPWRNLLRQTSTRISLSRRGITNTPLAIIMPGRRRVKGKKPKKRRRHHQDVEQSLQMRMANYSKLQMREYYIHNSEKDRFELDDLKSIRSGQSKLIWRVIHYLSSDAIKAPSRLSTKNTWTVTFLYLKRHQQVSQNLKWSYTELPALRSI